MQVSARVHYGCLAMIDLALHFDSDRPVALKEIVARQKIPQPFLVQILQSLRNAGLVTSVRGSGGGYRLSTTPEAISVLEIAEAIHGSQESLVPSSDCHDGHDPSEIVRSLWVRADDAAREVLSHTMLSDLATECRSDAAMFYI